ncbi:hypothetical protein DFJ74DRAFT_774248 [Hyaloraphidium curvatum]|nr:hypothetical protein DFJ74DRAFT_774248 [Hyaloraphidium curvatum]
MGNELLGFSAAEYAALFPRYGAALGGAADPEPLTHSGLAAAAALLPPFLRFQARLYAFWRTVPPRGTFFVVYTLWNTSMAALYAPAWAFGFGSLFQLRQLVVATVFRAGGLLLLPVHYALVVPGALGTRPAAAADSPGDFGGAAGIIRYRELEALQAAAPSRLLEHIAGDPFCPCPLPGCAAPLLGSGADLAAALRVATPFVLLVVRWCFGMSYTAFYTLASDTWSHAWSAFLCAAFVATSVTLVAAAHLFKGLEDTATNPPTLTLQTRLHNRALQLLLGSAVDACERVAADLQRGDAGPDPAAKLPNGDDYSELHARFSLMWKHSMATSNAFIRWFAVGMLFELPAIVGNLAVGSCITFTSLAVVLALLNVLHHLVTVAYANREVTVLARTEMATMLEAEENRAAFLGFPITGATVRGLVITAATLLVGLYSVLRAGGVFVTMEIACPG